MCVRACVWGVPACPMCACVRVRACAFLSVLVLARASVCVLASVRACVLVSVLLACVRAPHGLDSLPSHCECDVGACGCAYRRQTAPVACAHERAHMPPLMRCLPAGTARTSATTCSSSPRTSRYVVRSFPGESMPRSALPALHSTPFNCAALRRDNHAGPPNCASVLLYRVGLCACVRRSSCGGTRAEAAVCG